MLFCQAFALFVPDLRRTTGCLLTQLADLRVTLVCEVFIYLYIYLFIYLFIYLLIEQPTDDRQRLSAAATACLPVCLTVLHVGTEPLGPGTVKVGQGSVAEAKSAVGNVCSQLVLLNGTLDMSSKLSGPRTAEVRNVAFNRTLGAGVSVAKVRMCCWRVGGWVSGWMGRCLGDHAQPQSRSTCTAEHHFASTAF
jgi:hypothetical protein